MRQSVTLEVAVLGLGEAGGAIASGLAAAGCAVRGWDPGRGFSRASAFPDGVEPSDGLRAVAGADLVLSLTTAAHAVQAATGVASSLAEGQLYADLNTTAPALMREVAAVIGATGASFADVALLGPVPAKASARRRSRPEAAPSGSPSCCARSGCRSRSSAASRATRPG